MDVLVVGSGGREHALAWGLSRAPSVGKVYVAPGNGGTGDVAENVGIEATDLPALVAFARDRAIGLVVVGPEAPLVAGLVDALTEAGIPAFGPCAAAAELEGSKAFAKAMMDRARVPTARWASFRDENDALAWLAWTDFPVVVKASGLAAGKGVVIPDNKSEAEAAVRAMFAGALGSAGSEVVLEERLDGEETSLLAICDGERYVVLPAAQDHKRIGDGDTGPNTGGMGAYAPAPIAAGREQALAKQVIAPILAAFAADGTPFIGVLYAGIMMTADGPRVLEYNVRFGDPETQVLIPLIASDLGELLLSAATGKLDPEQVALHSDTAITVVAASEGYPGAYPKGRVIRGIDQANALEDVIVFHAGTRYDPASNELVTSGGRVLAVTARAPGIEAAIERAYQAIDHIDFDGITLRRDLGARAIGRKG